jgi:hypothetical protein
MTALRARLGAEQFVAEREAKKIVVQGLREDGPRHYFSVNSTDRARTFWPAIRSNAWPKGVERVLGRADFDWKRALDYFSGCGLARPLADRLDDRDLARWAPPFFADGVRARATRDALREFIVRETLGHLDEALGEIGVPGVLLKSAAMLARTPADGTTRAGGDVDVWVPPERAAGVREFLLQRGFSGPPLARRTAAHHLAAITSRGVLVELHTHLLPEFFGLPERDMLNRSMPLHGFRCLTTLDAQGALLHAVVHCTSHLFAHGFKAAWDVAQCLESENFDWGTLADWIEQMHVPRAFWTSFNVLLRELTLQAPGAFLNRSPRDLKQMRLETIARRRAFSAVDVAEELNPFSKNAVFLLMCDSPAAQMRVLLSLFGRHAADARKSNWQYMTQQSSTSLSHHLRSQLLEAWHQWQDYRVVVKSPQFRESVERVLQSSTTPGQA